MTTRFKCGDAFDATGPIPVIGADGQPLADYTGWTARCELRSRKDGALVDTLDVTLVDPATGSFRFHAPGGTGAWPPGEVMADVILIDPEGAEVTGETFFFTVIDRVTRS